MPGFLALGPRRALRRSLSNEKHVKNILVLVLGPHPPMFRGFSWLCSRVTPGGVPGTLQQWGWIWGQLCARQLPDSQDYLCGWCLKSFYGESWGV